MADGQSSDVGANLAAAPSGEAEIMETFIALYICLSGPTCPSTPVASSQSWYSEQTCAAEARLVAQGMFASSGDKYGFKCKRIDFEPPNLTSQAEKAK
jgi:hypothetical protein